MRANLDKICNAKAKARNRHSQGLKCFQESLGMSSIADLPTSEIGKTKEKKKKITTYQDGFPLVFQEDGRSSDFISSTKRRES